MAVSLIERLSDRRCFERFPVACGPSTSLLARVRPGRDVRLLDFSRGGALLQSTWRLLPGSGAELQLATREWRWATSGEVVRCQVCELTLDERVGYRAAVRFSRPAEPAVVKRVREANGGACEVETRGYQVPVAGSADPA